VKAHIVRCQRKLAFSRTDSIHPIKNAVGFSDQIVVAASGKPSWRTIQDGGRIKIIGMTIQYPDLCSKLDDNSIVYSGDIV
jgi:ribonuclease BN (tRNA processing enzyme)